MLTLNFDFQRYIADRKSKKDSELREGASYAFSPETDLTRRMGRVGIVKTVVTEAGRIFQNKTDLFVSSTATTSQSHSSLHNDLTLVCSRLHVQIPHVFLNPQSESTLLVLGFLEEYSLFLPLPLFHELAEPERLFVLGRLCGHIQNQHVAFLTALYSLQHTPSAFSRFLLKPATSALTFWLHRANITADRAGLLSCLDLEAACHAIENMTSDSNELSVRQMALREFSKSEYYCSLTRKPALSQTEFSPGVAKKDCDTAVELLLQGARR